MNARPGEVAIEEGGSPTGGGGGAAPGTTSRAAFPATHKSRRAGSSRRTLEREDAASCGRRGALE